MLKADKTEIMLRGLREQADASINTLNKQQTDKNLGRSTEGFVSHPLTVERDTPK